MHTRWAVVGLVVILSGIPACSSDDTTSSTSTKRSSTPTTEAVTTSAAPGTEGTDVWRQDAKELRGKDGSTHELTCTAGGTPDSVWGAGRYTDDSSICTAAVQSGLIGFSDGGTVTYEIGPAQDSFDGGVANGVTSQSYGRWDGSFTFPDAPPGSVKMVAGPESWSRNLADQRGKDGTRVTVACSADGVLGSVWGSGPYTDDSSVCTAAVHAGVLDRAKGGTVVAEIAAGQSAYTGSTANGVTTSDYGTFQGSFTFPADQKAG